MRLLYFCLGGKDKIILKNSWTKHFSLTYNEKYEFVLRGTWLGYQFFGTLSLVIYLLKVRETLNKQKGLKVTKEDLVDD